MKKLFSALLLGAVLSLSVANTGCSTLQTFFNSPDFQAELAKAEAIALQYAKDWFDSHFGAHKAGASLKTESAQNHMAAARAAIKLQAPHLSNSVINDIVVAKFSGQ